MSGAIDHFYLHVFAVGEGHKLLIVDDFGVRSGLNPHVKNTIHFISRKRQHILSLLVWHDTLRYRPH